jgi:hypothetical protein
VTRRNPAVFGLPVLAGLAGVLVLWCAWRIIGAELTLGTGLAAWGLWLVLTAAVVTAAFYVRELARHRVAGRGGAWRPLPSLVLLWIAGATSVGVFGFMLPTRADSAPATPTAAAASVPVTSAPTPEVGTTSAPAPTSSRPTPTPASRSQVRETPTPVRTTVVTPSPVSTSVAAPSSPTTSAPAPSPTSSPLITIVLPGHGGTKPPHTN